jgi:hypothetical protein
VSAARDRFVDAVDDALDGAAQGALSSARREILAAHDAAVAEAVAAVKADIDANWPGASLPRAIAEQTAGYLGGLTACAVVVKQAFARAVLAGDGE